MNLIKNDGTLPEKTHKIDIRTWPDIELSKGVGLSTRDGWNFGIGFGLALVIAIPIILLLSYFIIALVLALLGGF